MSSLVNAKKVDGKANPLEQAGQGRRASRQEDTDRGDLRSDKNCLFLWEKKLRQKSNVDLKFWINVLLSPFGSAK